MKRFIKLAVLGGIVFCGIKMMEAKKQLLVGTEDELRDRVRTKFGDKVPSEKLGRIEDKVVGFARSKGTLVEPAPEAEQPEAEAEEPASEEA